MKNNRNLKNYNPYVYLVLDEGNYEKEIMEYYNNYKENYGNDISFLRRVIYTNNEAIEWAINDFMLSNDNIRSSLEELKKKVNGIKKIVLITEGTNNTKTRFMMIDKKVNKAIDNKNKELFTEEDQMVLFDRLFEEFIQNNDYYAAVIEFKKNVMELIKQYEEIYSTKMFKKTSKKLYKLMNNIINERAKYMCTYVYYDIMVRDLIDNYKSRNIDNEVSYLKWVNWLKKDYKELKLEIKEIYPDNVYNKIIRKYDLLIDELIDYMMNKNDYLYTNDEKELSLLFDNYQKSIVDYDFDKYFDYVSEYERDIVKKEMCDSKNFQFKQRINEFNEKIRVKYSNRYSLIYIDDINKRVDKLIISNLKCVGLPSDSSKKTKVRMLKKK